MEKLRALIVEDSKNDAALLVRYLTKAGYEVESTVVKTSQEMAAALAHDDWDVILSDFSMPQFTGIEALSVARETGFDLPFIIISGTIGEDVAVEAMRLGADDYLLKGHLSRLSAAIQRELENAAGRRARKLTEAALRRSETSLARAQRIAQIGSWDWDVQHDQFHRSDETFRIFGLKAGPLSGTIADFMTGIHEQDRSRVQAAMDAALAGTNPYRLEHRILRPDGIERTVLGIGEVSWDESGRPAWFRGTVQDISERKHQETAVRDLTGQIERQARIFDTTLSSIIDFAYILDPDSRFVYANQALLDLWGLTFDEAVGKNFYELNYPTELAAHLQQQVDQVFATGEQLRDETPYASPTGAGGYYEYIYNPVFAADGSVEAIAGSTRDVTLRKQAEENLKQLNRKLESQRLRLNNIVASVPGVVWENWGRPDAVGEHSDFVSEYIETMVGYTVEEYLATPNFWLTMLHPDDREKTLAQTSRNFASGAIETIEFRWVAKDGRILWVESRSSAILDEQGETVGRRGVTMEITERKQAEASLEESEQQLRQAQKLESVGLLAGGIAHDFNNMLTVINGYSELALRRLKADDPMRRDLEEIRRAGKRSSELTYQLLAFSRQQLLQPIVLDLNEMIADTIKMLQRLIGEDIQLATTLDPKVARILVDPGQLAQIIMNLAINARDAMAPGGKLSIETANTFLDEAYARRHPGVSSGPYVQLAVSDNGVGIGKEARQHIFEPFYTTKPVGQGTGLGLATVYGIVKQSGGHIEVYSELGVGTQFKVYLPHALASPPREPEAHATADMPEGTETILLVEDEEQLRQLSREILTSCGYRVIEASNGAVALKLCDPPCKIDLLMTDVVMPIMGGRELAENLLETMPDLRILFTSGYTDDAVVRHGVIGSNTNFIHKPFTVGALANKVREILDRKSQNGRLAPPVA
jgi:PAS domain S-box-containing protein